MAAIPAFLVMPLLIWSSDVSRFSTALRAGRRARHGPPAACVSSPGHGHGATKVRPPVRSPRTLFNLQVRRVNRFIILIFVKLAIPVELSGMATLIGLCYTCCHSPLQAGSECGKVLCSTLLGGRACHALRQSLLHMLLVCTLVQNDALVLISFRSSLENLSGFCCRSGVVHALLHTVSGRCANA